MDYKNIKLSINNRVAVITNNRPEVLNAINFETISELRDCLKQLNSNPNISVIVLTGAGEKAFAAGADIKAIKERTMLDAIASEMQQFFTDLENYDKPTIAAVNGYALGGGCEIAMACDIRIAAENAKFGLPELNLAIIPGAGGTQRLSRLVGKGKAKELIFTGDIISAAEAEKIGLVNKVVQASELLNEANAMAEKMTKKGPLALKFAKIAINASTETDLQTGLMIEKLSQGILFTTEDKQEGATAFLEKRDPNFIGK